MASPLNNMSGTLSVYTPTMRERVVNWFAQNWYGDTREGYDQANKLMNVLDLTPVGAGADIYDVGRALGRGDYATAGITAVMAGLPGPAPKGVRAFHGSPHSFDKFSMDKIGTGEGAQAYGHGLYFAENEDVAQGYKEALSKSGFDIKQMADPYLRGSNEEAIRQLELAAKQAEFNGRKSEAADYRNTARWFAEGRPDQWSAGNVYEVNIDADPNAFLDWDKPLSEQPEAVQGFANSLKDKSFLARKRLEDTSAATGKDVWEKARNAFGVGQSDAAAKALSEAGIPGIKYLDAGSRVSPAMAAKELADWKAQLPIAEQELADAIKRNDKWLVGRKQAEVQRVKDGLAQATKGAEGTRNYVVFDDRLISIVRKYGIAGASAMLGYNLLENVSEAQAEELRQIEKGAK